MGGPRKVPLGKRPIRRGDLVRDASGTTGTVVKVERTLWPNQEFRESIYVDWSTGLGVSHACRCRGLSHEIDCPNGTLPH